MTAAGLARFIDHDTVEFVRTYPHPVERVWRAVSDPAEVSIWFIPPTVWDLKSGGAYRFHDKGDFAGPILAFDPPRLVRFGGPLAGGPDAFFQFELESAQGGTRLRYLQHHTTGFPDADEPRVEFAAPGRPGALAGWHSAFDELDELLDGVPINSRLPRTRFTEIVENWSGFDMAAEFTAEQKARIGRGLRVRERWFELIDIYSDHVTATRPRVAKTERA